MTNPVIEQAQKPLTERDGYLKVSGPLSRSGYFRYEMESDKRKLIAEIGRLEHVLASAREQGFNDCKQAVIDGIIYAQLHTPEPDEIMTARDIHIGNKSLEFMLEMVRSLTTKNHD